MSPEDLHRIAFAGGGGARAAAAAEVASQRTVAAVCFMRVIATVMFALTFVRVSLVYRRNLRSPPAARLCLLTLKRGK